ncbi:uncharacterized protein LOC131669950 [Phymastichus coffea]|uniref:uncharacterized protein LOC131669950 n=1 Tax=Phymastichus coffea TaxID=108790 RepID=UPI00273BA300|nr:uncharacterized protein LOC131669950 [Phymastichus coffea]
MLSSMTVIAVLFLLCCGQFQNANAVIEVAEKSHRFDQGFLFLDASSFKDGNLVYATCDRNTTSMTKCKVVQENYPYEDITHSCSITLRGDHEDSDLSVRIGISALGKDKAILVWTDYHNTSTTIEIGTVSLKTCKMNKIKIPDAGIAVFAEMIHTNKIVAYNDDSYDIFFDDLKRCGGRMCKLQVSADGKAKGEPAAAKMANGFVSYASSVATHSPAKGYAYVKKIGDNSVLYLLKPDGTEKQLAKYEGIPIRVVSVGNDFISACTNATEVTCTQFEDDGDVKLTTTMSDINKNTKPVSVNNLADGSILVLFAEFKQCEPQAGCNGVTGYQVVKISSDGKKTGTLKTQELETATGVTRKSYIYKNGDEGYCAAVIGQNSTTNENEPSDFRIVVNCFTDADFSTE